MNTKLYDQYIELGLYSRSGTAHCLFCSIDYKDRCPIDTSMRLFSRMTHILISSYIERPLDRIVNQSPRN